MCCRVYYRALYLTDNIRAISVEVFANFFMHLLTQVRDSYRVLVPYIHHNDRALLLNLSTKTSLDPTSSNKKNFHKIMSSQDCTRAALLLGLVNSYNYRLDGR